MPQSDPPRPHVRPERAPRLVRDLRAGPLVDLFFVSAVIAVLGIRFYLHATGYPQVGGASLHVAHMLWGGLLMMVALLLVLGFLGRPVRRWAAVLGGLGFGTFIDEVGKFVTRDHDYFYRPAIAIMYVVFVTAYVALRLVRMRRVRSPEEYVVNALHEMEEAALHDLQLDEQERALHYLRQVHPPTPLARELAGLLTRLDLAPTRKPGPFARLGTAVLRRYRALTVRPAFWRALIIFFVVQVVVKLVLVAVLAVSTWTDVNTFARIPLLSAEIDEYRLAEWLQLASSLASAGLVAAGVIAIRVSRRLALRYFQLSILLSVFVTQVFMFFLAQWAALLVLSFNIVVLVGLGYMQAHERRPEEERQAGAG